MIGRLLTARDVTELLGHWPDGREASTIFRPSWASSRSRCGLSIPFELLLIERAGGRFLARVFPVVG
jgi:hypothetical protein